MYSSDKYQYTMFFFKCLFEFQGVGGYIKLSVDPQIKHSHYIDGPGHMSPHESSAVIS